MDIASFLFGVALGLVLGGLVAWLAGRVTTARILARLDAERQGSAEKLALLGVTSDELAAVPRIEQTTATSRPVLP
jgi:hypothetical protein